MRIAHRLSTRLAEAMPGGEALALDRPLASLTFDDFPRSAWTRGGPILAQYDVRASFYPAGSFCGRAVEGVEQFTASDLREVRDAGHEIGCHSFSHRAAPGLSAAAFTTDLDRNAAFLASEAGLRPTTFAYPYGLLSPGAVRVVRPRFAAARRVKGGVNARGFDPARTAAVSLEARSWTPARIEAAVAQAVRRRGWLVLFAHDVSDAPSPYGCTPPMLEHALETLARAGVEGLPVAEVALRARRDSNAPD